MSGPQSTTKLDHILERGASRHHMSLQKAMSRVAGPFPLAGPATWSNDWHAYRPCPTPHLHEGQDLDAPEGTPIVAIANSSVIGKGSDPASGNFVEIRNSRGTEFFYCHLSGYAPGIHTGQRVRQGQLLGYVGATGDATGPHLHLQVEPNGVPAPPKPWIDRWLLKALGQARALAGMTTARPPAARQDGAGGVVLPRHVMVEDVESGASTSGRSGQGAARARPSVQTVQSQASHGMPVGVPAAGFVILSMALTLAVLARRQPTHPG